MAIAQNQKAELAPFGIVNRLYTGITQARRFQVRRKAYRQTFKELNALSQRELRDLGLNRSMIRGLAKEAANAA